MRVTESDNGNLVAIPSAEALERGLGNDGWDGNHLNHILDVTGGPMKRLAEGGWCLVDKEEVTGRFA